MEKYLVWFVAFNLGWILRGMWEKNKLLAQDKNVKLIPCRKGDEANWEPTTDDP